MYLWLTSDTARTAFLIKGREARAAAMSRAFYVALRSVGHLFTAVADAAGRLTAWHEQRTRARRAIATLRAFDDRQLSDIGIGRGEIRAAVYQDIGRRGVQRERQQRRSWPGRGPARPQAAPNWKKAA